MRRRSPTRRPRRAGWRGSVAAIAVLGVIAVVLANGKSNEDTQVQSAPTPTSAIERNAPAVIPLDTPAPATPTETQIPLAEPPTSTPIPPTATPFPLPVDTATPVPVPTTCACTDNLYNCDDFASSYFKGDEAQACYLHCMEVVGFDVHELDRDVDGGACEWEQ